MSEDDRTKGQKAIEAAIARMLSAHGKTLDKPIEWHHDFDRDIFTLEAHMSGVKRLWTLYGESVEDYATDQNVRDAIDSNFETYFIPD